MNSDSDIASYVGNRLLKYVASSVLHINKKRNLSEGEKYKTKVVENCSSYCSKFFLF